MDVLLWFAVFAAVALGLYYFEVLMIAFALMVREVKIPPSSVLPDAEIPPSVLGFTQSTREELEALGFKYICAMRQESKAPEPESNSVMLVYWEPETLSFAKILELDCIVAENAYLVMFSTELAGGSPLITTDCHAHLLITAPDAPQIQDEYTGSLETQWFRHKSKLNLNPAFVDDNSPIAKPLAEPKRVLQHHNDEIWELREALISSGFLLRLGRHMTIANPLRILAWASRISQGNRRAAAAHQATGTAPVEEQRAVAARFMSRTSATSGWTKGVLLLTSLALFTLIFGSWIAWEAVPILIVILLLHELGHYLAMAAFGYHDKSIYFLPFGAAATGKKDKEVAWQQFVIYLMGPIPGIVLGVLLLLSGWGEKYELIETYAFMSIVLNYLNLLPIYPLDGGQIVEKLVFYRLPRAKFVFIALSLAVLVGAAIYFEDWIIGVVALLIGLSLSGSWQLQRMTRLIAPTIGPRDSSLEKRDKILEHLLEGSNRSMGAAQRVSFAQRLLAQFERVHSSRAAASLFLSAYMVMLIVPLVATAWMMPGFPNLSSSYAYEDEKHPRYWRELLDESSEATERWYNLVGAIRSVDFTKHPDSKATFFSELRALQPEMNAAGLAQAELEILEYLHDRREFSQSNWSQTANGLERSAYEEPMLAASLFNQLAQIDETVPVADRVAWVDSAIDLIRRQNINPQSNHTLVSYLYSKARLLQQAGDAQSAIEIYQEGVVLESALVDDLNWNMHSDALFDLYFELKRIPEAIELTRQVIQRAQLHAESVEAKPDSREFAVRYANRRMTELYQRLGWLLLLNGNVAQSRDAFSAEFDYQQTKDLGKGFVRRIRIEAILDNLAEQLFLSDSELDRERQQRFSSLLAEQDSAEVNKFIRDCECRNPNGLTKLRIDNYLSLLSRYGLR